MNIVSGDENGLRGGVRIPWRLFWTVIGVPQGSRRRPAAFSGCLLRATRKNVPKRSQKERPKGVILDVIFDDFFMFFVMSNFDRKSMICCKVSFYLNETIDFDAQGSLWEVPDLAQMVQKWSQRPRTKV